MHIAVHILRLFLQRKHLILGAKKQNSTTKSESHPYPNALLYYYYRDERIKTTIK